MKNKIELKPCPFCGEKRITENNILYFAQKSFAVVCPTCEVNGPYGENPSEAVKLWNRRVSCKN